MQSGKSHYQPYHDGELEFRADTGSSCSTHGYFKSWKDEVLTPSQSWDSESWFFQMRLDSKLNVNYLMISIELSIDFRPWNGGRRSMMSSEMDNTLLNHPSAMYELGCERKWTPTNKFCHLYEPYLARPSQTKNVVISLILVSTSTYSIILWSYKAFKQTAWN